MTYRSVAVLVLLSGCASTDPMHRAGLWEPTGANDANLRLMVADRRDLLNGQAEPAADGAVAAKAVARYRAGKVKDLPDTGVAKIGASGSTSDGSGGSGTEGAP